MTVCYQCLWIVCGICDACCRPSHAYPTALLHRTDCADPPPRVAVVYAAMKANLRYEVFCRRPVVLCHRRSFQWENHRDQYVVNGMTTLLAVRRGQSSCCFLHGLLRACGFAYRREWTDCVLSKGNMTSANEIKSQIDHKLKISFHLILFETKQISLCEKR